MLSPVTVFCFKRLNEVKETITSLAANYLAQDTVLYIFSDGPRCDHDIRAVNDVRAYLKTVTGFKKVFIIEQTTNKGLAKSVIGGVTYVLKKHSKIIVVEDDLVTSPNFLNFMNQALDFYSGNTKVLSISGFTLPLKNMPDNTDFYTSYRASSWAWGTWESKWQDVDWDIPDYKELCRNRKYRRAFNRGGSDMAKMLKDQINGEIDSWAIRFCYHQFRKDMVTVFPTLSKAANIGFGVGATHTFSESRFRTFLDIGDKRKFSFSNHVDVAPQIAREFRRFFSLRVRIVGRIKRHITKLNLVRK